MASPKAIERRRKTAIAAAKKLEAAAAALRGFLSACNECDDETASLSVQGKGIDGRDKLIADCSEYAHYLDSIYNRAQD